MNKTILLLILLTVGSLMGYTQQLTLSPYSRYGMGEIPNISTARNAAMGGIGVATGNYFSVNRINPASFADLVFTSLDISAFGQYSNLRTNSQEESQVTAGFQNILFGFPSNKNLTFAFGFSPYSAVGYEVGSEGMLATEDTVFEAATQYVGDGGINQAFLGAAAKALKGRLRIGASFSYSFGNTRYRTETVILNDAQAHPVSISEEIFVGGISTQLGVVYGDTISGKGTDKKTVMRLGLTADYGFKLNGTREKILDNLSVFDTLIFNEGFVRPPVKYGLGVEFSRYGKWAWGADVTLQNWEKLEYFGETGATQNLGQEFRVGTGFEYVPNIQSLKYLKRIHYRVGAYFKESYISFNGDPIRDYGVTFGFGLPSVPKITDRFNPGRTTSQINLSFALGRRGSLSGNLPLEELYVRMRLGITLNDTWFVRRQVD